MSRRVCKPCWATNCLKCDDPDSCPCNHWPLAPECDCDLSRGDAE